MYTDLSPPTIDFQNLSLPHLAKKEEEGLNAIQDCYLAAKPDDQSPIPRTIMVKEENRLLQAVP